MLPDLRPLFQASLADVVTPLSATVDAFVIRIVVSATKGPPRR